MTPQAQAAAQTQAAQPQRGQPGTTPADASSAGAAGGWRRAAATTGAITAVRARASARPWRRQPGSGSQAGPAGSATDSAAARSEPRRRLPVRRQGCDLDAREQLQRAADVLQPDARGSDQRQDRLRRRSALGEVARWWTHLRNARQRRRQQLPRSCRPACDVDRSEEPEASDHRQRRRVEHLVGPGPDVGLRQHDGHSASVLGQRRHAPAVLRLHRPAGQRQLGRAECHPPAGQRHPQLRLVRHRRRRRLPDRRRSDRSQHRLYRITGRQYLPVRPADRPTAEHPAARHRRRRSRWRWRWRRRGGPRSRRRC